MCGLVGIYSLQFGAAEYDIFKKLMFLSFMRGEDSTGIIRADANGNVHSRKSILASPEFIRSEYAEIMSDQGKYKGKKPVLLLGHTRAATKGAVSVRNAHPFSFDKVVGMHNGTIHKQFKHRSEYETDTEALYRNINDYGLVKAIEEVNAYDTAYALQYVNKDDGTLNIIKNSKRTLSFTFLYNRTTLVWASERKMIEFVLDSKKLSNNEGWDKDKKDDKFFTLNVNNLLSLELGRPLSELELEDLKIEEKKTYQSTTYPTYTTQSTYYGGKGSTTYQSSQTPTQEGTKLPYQDGAWIKVPTGYQWVKRRGPTQDTKSQTTTTTESSSTDVPSTGTNTHSTSTQKTSTTASASDKPTKDGHGYSNIRDSASWEQLKQLSWLQPVQLPDERPAEDPEEVEDTESVTSKLFNDYEKSKGFKDDKHLIKGFEGQSVSESEFRYRLSSGCFSCGSVYSMDDPHDFHGINNIHWYSREYWACDECFRSEDNDSFIRRAIENNWEEELPPLKAKA